MNFTSFYYNCSATYINSIDPILENQIEDLLRKLLERENRENIIRDIFWLLTSSGWSFYSIPAYVNNEPPSDLNLSTDLSKIKTANSPELCKTSAHIDTRTQSDFAKLFGAQIVQIETQSGDLGEIAIDFTKFRIGFAEKRIGLGIEIIFYDQNAILSQKRKAGDSEFEKIKDMLSALKLDCPIWLIGLQSINR